MADPTPPRDGLGPLIDRMAVMESRLRELEKPTATQYANAVGNLVQFGSSGGSDVGFEIPTAWTPVRAGTIDIPAGYTRGLVIAIANIGAWNGTAAADYLYVRCEIDGLGGGTLIETVTPSSFRSVSASAVRTMAGLNGGTISVKALCRSDAGWPASTTNIANLDAIALFAK